jgi:DNA-binding NarL/FixJ family response regulator
MTEQQRPIRILVLEDHRIVGDGVASALEVLGGFVADGVVASLAEVEAHMARPSGGEPIDVVVADIDLGDSYSFGLPAALGPAGPRVLYLSAHDEPSVVRAALESGAAGLVHKQAPTAQLADAIRRVVAGESAFSLADIATARAAPINPTARERQVLRGIVHGLANKEIAGPLCIEERTVESHVRRMLDRYGVSNRTELAVLALREGWADVRA